MVSPPAPLAPELAYKEDLHGKERAGRAKQVGRAFVGVVKLFDLVLI